MMFFKLCKRRPLGGVILVVQGVAAVVASNFYRSFIPNSLFEINDASADVCATLPSDVSTKSDVVVVVGAGVNPVVNK